MKRFADRVEAGRALARTLRRYGDAPELLVLGLPRGGVPVAAEVARALNAPLDVLLVRKLGLPGHEELAMGAVSGGGGIFVNQDAVDTFGVPASVIDAAAKRERAEIARRETLYRQGLEPLVVKGKTILLVDDGIATGSTMIAGLRALRAMDPGRLVAAVPVAPVETIRRLRAEADEVTCLMTPCPFVSVGSWYDSFVQTSDSDVVTILREARRRHRPRPGG